MNRHYNSSAPFSWLRKKVFKIDKPVALGWGQWSKWEEKIKEEKPVGYFFTETLPDWLEWIPEHSIDYVDKVRYYFINRTEGSHRLDSTLKKGQYHEFSERILYSLFDSYIDFVEIEEAHMHVVFSSKEDRAKYNMPLWNKYRILRWFGRWRCPQAAVDHLKWEMTLDVPDPNDPHWQSNPYQAEKAREKMALYTWWKHVRPTRGEAWEVSGFQAFWDKMEAKYGHDWLGLGSTSKMTAAEHRTYDKLQEDKEKLEEDWYQEDNEMMIRLIKIRRDLWT